jgi:hypothetical protein
MRSLVSACVIAGVLLLVGIIAGSIVWIDYSNRWTIACAQQGGVRFDSVNGGQKLCVREPKIVAVAVPAF